MKLKIGFSPCPNDTFIFDALVNKKIDTGDLEFDVVLEDVQTLNEWANKGRLDVTKISFPALFQNINQYAYLNSGAALGKGVGPLLIAKTMVNLSEVNQCRIGIPGEQTTANFLLSFAFPEAKNKVPMMFSSIEDSVLKGEVDLGVIIHENRFTYKSKGLIKVCDLGEVWEEKQNAPIPLGCIAIKKSYPEEVKNKVETLIMESTIYAMKRLPEVSTYVSDHAQEMHEDVMRQHIDLYVNEYTVDLKKEGIEAIRMLQQVYLQKIR